MRKNAKQFIELNCSHCHSLFRKELREYTRQKKRGRKIFFCSLSCAGFANPALMENARYNKEHPDLACKKLHSAPNFRTRADEYSPFRYILHNIRSRYKSKLTRGKGFLPEFDEQYLKELWGSQNGKCAYTNIPMILPRHTGKRSPINMGSLDRIDSSVGYVKGNVEFVCIGINYAKNAYTKQQVIDFIKEIVKCHTLG